MSDEQVNWYTGPPTVETDDDSHPEEIGRVDLDPNNDLSGGCEDDGCDDPMMPDEDWQQGGEDGPEVQ